MKPWKRGINLYRGKEYVRAKGKYFLVQPIRWKILKREGSEALIVSDRILDACQYNEWYSGLKGGHYASNYKESEIRGWLNGEFLTSAFPRDDNRILTKEVENSARTTKSPNNKYACENTMDKAFLLSYQDCQNLSYGFVDDASRQCPPTDYAMVKGVYLSRGSGWLWTRSPSADSSNCSQGVGFGGDIDDAGTIYDHGGIHPALWPNIAE